MANARRILWIVWAAMLASVGLSLAVALSVSPRPDPWNAGESAVANFVVAMAALAAGVGTFALREALAMRPMRTGALDPSTPQGFARLRGALIVLWALCEAIALLGLGLALASGAPAGVWPYAIGAALLLIRHAPRDSLFARRPAAAPGT